MTYESIRDSHNQDIKDAAAMLRSARNVPDDQDIDIKEALQLVNRGEEIQALLDEIDRLSQLLLDAGNAALDKHCDHNATGANAAVEDSG